MFEDSQLCPFFRIMQAHAASAVLNFSENCTPDILTPYMDGVVRKLLILLQVYISYMYFLSFCSIRTYHIMLHSFLTIFVSTVYVNI